MLGQQQVIWGYGDDNYILLRIRLYNVGRHWSHWPTQIHPTQSNLVRGAPHTILAYPTRYFDLFIPTESLLDISFTTQSSRIVVFVPTQNLGLVLANEV